jgi:hypothetical protein
MSARLGRRTWLALSALVVILLFATVAADAKLYGTRPPSSSSVTAQASTAVCLDSELCAQRTGPMRKAARHHGAGNDCPTTPIFPTL